MQALQLTLEFGVELAEKFGGGTQNKRLGMRLKKYTNSSRNASDIQKYEKKAIDSVYKEICYLQMTIMVWFCIDMKAMEAKI